MPGSQHANQEDNQAHQHNQIAVYCIYPEPWAVGIYPIDAGQIALPQTYIGPHKSVNRIGGSNYQGSCRDDKKKEYVFPGKPAVHMDIPAGKC